MAKHFLSKIDADSSSSSDDDDFPSETHSSLHKFLIDPTKQTKNTFNNREVSVFSDISSTNNEEKSASRIEDKSIKIELFSSVTTDAAGMRDVDAKLQSHKSAMDEILTITKSKRRESISKTIQASQGLGSIEMKPDGSTEVPVVQSKERSTNDPISSVYSALLADFVPSVQNITVEADNKKVSQLADNKYSADSNVRRKIVKLSSDTLRGIFKDKSDIGSTTSYSST